MTMVNSGLKGLNPFRHEISRCGSHGVIQSHLMEATGCSREGDCGTAWRGQATAQYSSKPGWSLVQCLALAPVTLEHHSSSHLSTCTDYLLNTHYYLSPSCRLRVVYASSPYCTAIRDESGLVRIFFNVITQSSLGDDVKL